MQALGAWEYQVLSWRRKPYAASRQVMLIREVKFTELEMVSQVRRRNIYSFASSLLDLGSTLKRSTC